MSVALSAPALAPTRPRPRRRTAAWAAVLIVLGLFSAALTLWSVWDGSRSDYYASIALSMSKSWSNFFFGALDPAGTVTLDKIPGSYWLPALSVRLLGFSTFSVVLPNALAAVAATLVTGIAGRRLGGPAGGLVAGAVVASTPILVAVSRSNQPESFFVLALALTAWAAVNAVRLARLRWLLLAGVFVAIGFQGYMLEAWAVWPALAAAYLCTRQPLLRRIRHLAAAGIVSAALSVSWIAIVALIPSGSRPYLGSTLHDNPWEMVFGYNGLGRFGQATADSSAYNSFTPPFSGDPGVLRLFNEQLAGQVGWLIPAAILAVVLLARLRFPAAVWTLLGVWLATFLVMFSVVAGMHQFYTAALAVPMGLAIGAAYGRAHRRRIAWPRVALVATAVCTAAAIALRYGGYSVPVAVVQAIVAVPAVGLIVWGRAGWMRRTGVAAALVAMLLTPTAWSVVAIANPSATNPVAGGVSDVGGMTGSRGGFTAGPPAANAGPGVGGTGPRPLAGGSAAGGTPPSSGPNGGRFGGGLSGTSDQTAVLDYVQTHAGSGKYRLAVFGAQAAAPLIIASDGASILPIGGFSGDDPVPTLDAFISMVDAGDIPYVLATGAGGGFGGSETTTSGQILDWVEANCTVVADADIQGLYACTTTSRD